MAQSNRLRDGVRRAILGEGEDVPLFENQSGVLPTNGSNKPLAEANVQPPGKRHPALDIAKGVFEALERFGAGFQGKEDPVSKRRDREALVKQEQQKFHHA